MALQSAAAMKPAPAAEARKLFEAWATDSLVFFTVLEKRAGAVIGSCNLWGGEAKNRDYQLSIVLRRESWSQGFGTETLRFVARYAFGELGVHRLSLRVIASNERAVRAYRRAGFVEEGRLRQSFLRDGAWHDELVMGHLGEGIAPA
jgi:RimJ/RimL family protein N-acetyltransferase